MLETLEISGAEEERISAENLKLIVDSCPKLRVLHVYNIDGLGALELVSSSLERVELSQLSPKADESLTCSVTLETPALRELFVDTNNLNIRSHSLKKLEVMDQKELTVVGMTPPLANLEYLKLGPLATLDKMNQLLARISGGCVDVLQVAAHFLPREISVSLGSFLEPLLHVRTLQIKCNFMQLLTRSRDFQQGRALNRLGVEEMEVEVDALIAKGVRDAEQNQHLDETMFQLRSYLGSPSMRKLVITCCFTEYDIQGSNRKIGKWRRALKTLLKSLREEFPRLVSLRYYDIDLD